MGNSGSEKTFPKRSESKTHASLDDPRLPLRLFHHHGLTNDYGNGKLINQKTLVGRLNHLNFTNGHVFVHLRHPKYDEGILAKAFPEPCLGNELTCQWADDKIAGLGVAHYRFEHLILDDGEPMVLVPAQLLKITNDYVRISLPAKSYAVGHRKARRYTCQGVEAELIQNAFVAKGELIDFSAKGFRIRVRPERPGSFHWFNPDLLFATNLRNDHRVLFSGLCEFVRQQGELDQRDIVLAPTNENISRFKARRFRNLRQKLVPPPTFIFEHPLLKKRRELIVTDISTSGFSVYEQADQGVLMPGLIIPELTINFAGALRIKCSAQVIHRSKDNDHGVRHGLAILDMDINTYSRLTDILLNALDPYSHVSGEVDMDALWELFFSTGFMYPEKYGLIHSHREEFKELYKKLYLESPEIARHFTYQKNGQIYSHISMVRAYEKAWMVQHHASRNMGKKRTGIMVLKQIIHYMNDAYRLPSAKMDYVMIYFRPQNRFPDKVFGGFSRHLKNPKGCSMDLFSYMLLPKGSVENELEDGWSLKESSALDLWELSRFYNYTSNGLLLDALGLGFEQNNSGDETLEKTCSRLGFFRKWQTYSLKYEGNLKAVIIVDQSDLGLNLSELLNGLKVLVTDVEDLSWNALRMALGQLTGVYHMERIPVLIYPFEYVEAKEVPFDKQYQLLVGNAEYVEEFKRYMRMAFKSDF